MSELRALRNIRLCTKDCLCLYVCPTGASDTENGQIDASKCTGCGMCVQACPSHALSLVPYVYPPQQVKEKEVLDDLHRLISSKAKQVSSLHYLKTHTNQPIVAQLAQAMETSNRVMGEDLAREAGYMLPQSQNTHDLLTLIAVSYTHLQGNAELRETMRAITDNKLGHILTILAIVTNMNTPGQERKIQS